ncbi:MAG: hypothetical protein CL666_16565 [Balneola sp.]|nr:hypothetical protein [Balneola sp.]
MKKIYLSIIIVLMSVSFALAQDAKTNHKFIAEGDEIARVLSTGSVHTYQLELGEAQYVFGKVDQQTVDVVVTIKNPEGKVAAEFDGPARGGETFQLISKAAGTYTIEVTPFEDSEGDYVIRLLKVEPSAQDPEGKVDQLMSEYSGDVPGAAVMVLQNGNVLLNNSYGMANLAYDVEMNENSIHNIGSTSKHFLTFGLLLLQEEGKLDLDDDIREYLPELPEFDHPVTLRHVVNHTSGYREFVNLLIMTGRNISTPVSQDKVIEIVQRQPELQNVPGAEFNYNNSGYVLSTEVIERITEMPFPEWMEENVFLPMGMRNTVVRSSPNQIVENRTFGYQYNEDGRVEEVTDLGGAMGPGGIHASMDDLRKWVENLLNPTVGTEAMIREMSTPFTLKSGDETGYGLGLFIDDYKGLKRLHHGGADLAHRSNLMVFPEINAAVITQSNFANFRGDIGNRVVDIYFGDMMEEAAEKEKEAAEAKDKAKEFDYDPEQFDPLTGRYELSIMPGFILTFDRNGDRLFTQATGQPEVDITATSDSTFSLVGVPASITFHINEDGSADSLTLHQNGNHIAKKIEFELSLEDMKEYTGRYFSGEIETIYDVAVVDSGLVIQNYQMENDISLTAGNTDSFSAEFPLTEVEFIRNEQGEIQGFTASNGRTRGILFEKWE